MTDINQNADRRAWLADAAAEAACGHISTWAAGGVTDGGVVSRLVLQRRHRRVGHPAASRGWQDVEASAFNRDIGIGVLRVIYGLHVQPALL